MNKRKVGSLYEDFIAEYLLNNGFHILNRNFFCKFGEIDIIALKDNILRFIEVKYRKNEQYGNAVESITRHKLQKMYLTAQIYMKKYHFPSDTAISFDVLAITGRKTIYVENCYGIM